MSRLIAAIFCILLLVFATADPAAADQTPTSFVRAILDTPAGVMSFARAKQAVDRSTSIDEAATLAELCGMVAIIHKMLAILPPAEAVTDMEKMKALRAFFYEQASCSLSGR